jgi:hypothetical protein
LDIVLARIREIRERLSASHLLSAEPYLHGVALELADRATAPIREVIRAHTGLTNAY